MTRSSSRRTGWTVPALALASLVALPVLVVLAQVTADSGGVWSHLRETVLPGYLKNSLLLVLGVGCGAVVLGTGTAWLTTVFDFPGRRQFSWALLLPLAMPTYLMAYACTDLLQFSGPLQSWLRESFGWSRGDYWFPEIRSLGGAVLAFTFVLYPYVFLLARASFREQSLGVLEASRSLGHGPWSTFFKVALPLARPGIAAGASLVAMETLADYGAVDHFAIDTFTTGIYRTWTSLDSTTAASQLAAVLVLCVAAVLGLERLARGGARYASSRTPRAFRRRALTGWRAVASTTACALPLLVGFGLPFLVLVAQALRADHGRVAADSLELVGNTLLVAAFTVVVVVAIGLLLAYASRLDGTRLIAFASRVVSLGYAVPGSVIAIGVLVTLGGFTEATGLLAVGTLVGLVYAHAVRFSSLSVQTLDAGLQRIAPSLDQAARTLGEGPGGVLKRIHAPLLRGSLLTATLLVFVDVMKELPATMILRPFDFDTLAVRVHHYASDERLAQAALPALLIVAVGLVPVILLSRAVDEGTTDDGSSA